MIGRLIGRLQTGLLPPTLRPENRDVARDASGPGTPPFKIYCDGRVNAQRQRARWGHGLSSSFVSSIPDVHVGAADKS